MLQQLAHGTGPDPATAVLHFDAGFLKLLPAQQIAAVFSQIRSAGPYTLAGFSGTANSGLMTLRGTGGQRFLISISADTTGLISGLRIRPGAPLPVVRSLGDLDTALAQLGINASVRLSQVDSTGSANSCVPEHTSGDQGAHPLGSMFKLYVLGAVATAVAAGTLSWNQPLTVTEQVKSLPSGQLQNTPAGTIVTVQRAAELMISISDNTAADMLINAVGRPAVEAALVKMGVEHPSLLTPFLKTREMFLLDGDAPLRKQWAADGAIDPDTGAALPPSAAQVAVRGRLLQELPTTAPSVNGLGATPGWTDGLEWFATAADICRAHVALQAMAATPAGAPLRAILSRNPGVEVGRSWKYVAFKGGSDSGVLAGSWYLQAANGSRQVLVVQMSAEDAAKIPDTEWFASALGGAIRSLA